MGDLGENAPSDAPSFLALACESIAAYGSFAHGGKERIRKLSLAHPIEHATKPSGQCLLPSQNTQSPGCVCLSYQLPRIRGHRRHAPTCALRPTGQASSLFSPTMRWLRSALPLISVPLRPVRCLILQCASSKSTSALSSLTLVQNARFTGSHRSELRLAHIRCLLADAAGRIATFRHRLP